jgi:antitoxin ParD1/3/4
MATLKISLPDELIAFVESEVSSGNYPSQDEYFRDIVELHRLEERRLAEVRTEIQAGIDEADRGEVIEYNSVEECVNHTVLEGQKLLNARRAVKR